MYWTDWGSDPKIERSSMDGSERRVLVSYGLFWPNGLVLDRDEQRLYWADAGTKRIEFTSLDGSYREILISLNVPHPFGLAIHNDQIYWTDWERKSVERANKMTGLNRETVRAGLEDLMDIKVFHHNRPTNLDKPCIAHKTDVHLP
nr:low-density lipoprotein receptor-related protein 4-like [Lytechinus pictus]